MKTNKPNMNLLHYFLESFYQATAHDMETQIFLDQTLALGIRKGHQTWIVAMRAPTSCARTWNAFWAMPVLDMIIFQVNNGCSFTASFLIQCYRFP